MIDFQDRITSILRSDAEAFHDRDPETFFASHIGFCPRQLYVNKLGLDDDRDRRGKYRATRLIQSYLERRIEEECPELEPNVGMNIDEDSVQFIGRCSFYDPEARAVYALKVRNGWYKFNPPVERHVDQLHVYMRGLGVDRGRLVYVSKNDLADLRRWPHDDQTPFEVFDESRFNRLREKAERVRDEIWTSGIATNPSAIPFDRCGCHFCNTESLSFPRSSPLDESHPTVQSSPESAEVETSPGNVSQPGTSQTASPDGGQLIQYRSDTSCEVLETDHQHIPADLREREMWVVWDGRSKLALAPWQEGTMYPCEWAQDKNLDPRQSFQKAQMVAELPIEEIHRVWPFPDSDDLPACVYPAILLPHDPPDPPLSFVDFDDVRDPDTGAVPAEVIGLIDALGGYTEVSQSGTGLHVYVRGALPPTTGSFTAPLDSRGSIEMYDRSRFTGGTWEHVTGTPLDVIPTAQDVLDDIVVRY